MHAQAASFTETGRHPTSVLRGQPHRRGPFGIIARPKRLTRNSDIYREDEAAQYLYQVASGAVRAYNILEDGRDQNGAFYLPGDSFGSEAGDSHISSVAAAKDTEFGLGSLANGRNASSLDVPPGTPQ
ncbi:cyclic nucleotide-binding domain-containing protein [Bradyrhizobium zhanjiangense]|uniref:Cyclic nucleotide-binding domain-containing protein n=1 Tax=Bradyrhizobium zhanjiangense TaxID=1325107 RepID=A0ABY0DDS1_9BRAD|nr:hypothetical protein EAS62_31775 [Bradyrhizobium zhanjiangense]